MSLPFFQRFNLLSQSNLSILNCLNTVVVKKLLTFQIGNSFESVFTSAGIGFITAVSFYDLQDNFIQLYEIRSLKEGQFKIVEQIRTVSNLK